jgi:hypothetical protein
MKTHRSRNQSGGRFARARRDDLVTIGGERWPAPILATLGLASLEPGWGLLLTALASLVAIWPLVVLRRGRARAA